jgi:3-deoxy-D-manno-octulosonate 8-phosphate phosphatase (KDO 8-P phosphatase)
MSPRTPARKTRTRAAGRIRFVVLDVDGVLTDGRVTYDSTGKQYQSFDVHDGYGIRMAMSRGIRFALISGRRSKVLEFRARDLGITDVHQGVRDKLKVFRKLLTRHGYTAAETCVIGDDEPDIPILRAAGFSAAPRGAVREVREEVDYVTKKHGGRGAVREVLDRISRKGSTRRR